MSHPSSSPDLRLRVLASLLPLVSLACASSTPRPETPQPETRDPAVLTFAWPDGARATVRYSVEGWRQEGSTKSSVQRTLHYDMDVRHEGSGGQVVITRHWDRVPGLANRLGGFRFRSEGALQQLVDDAPEIVPTLRVSAEGELLSVGGGEALRERLEEVLDEGDTNPVTAVRVRPLFENAGLFLLSSQSWRGMVSVWAGRHPERDFPIVDTSGAHVPGAPRRVRVPGRGEMLGRVPCLETETELRCVQLRWSASPRGADAEAAIEHLEARGTDDLALTRTVTLVADPATLLPYSTRDHLTARRVIDRGGEEIEASEEMTRTRRFEWTLP